MNTARWQSWHAAFEAAGAAGGTARLVVAPRDFAAALADLGAAALGPREQQEACRTGYLLRYDARGRRVVLARTDSEVARQWCSGQEAAQAAEDEARLEHAAMAHVPFAGLSAKSLEVVDHDSTGLEIAPGLVEVVAKKTKKGGKK